MNLVKKFLKWFRGKDQLTKAQLQEVVADLAPQTIPPQIRTPQDLLAAQRIRTLQDLTAFCDEVRKTLAIMKTTSQKVLHNDAILKHSVDMLYVEVGNMNDKIRALAPRVKDKS